MSDEIKRIVDRLEDKGVASFSGPDSEGYFCVQEECDQYNYTMLSREELRTLAYELLAMAELPNAPPPPPPPTEQQRFWAAVAELKEIDVTVSRKRITPEGYFESVCNQADALVGDIVALGDACYVVHKVSKVISNAPSVTVGFRPQASQFRPRVDLSDAIQAWFSSSELSVRATRVTKDGCGMYSDPAEPV